MKLKTINIKGKEYVEVKERILYLAETRDNDGINYNIETNHFYYPERKLWVVKAKLTWGSSIYEGTAQEIESDNYKEVNYSSALENCETSAVGRACAMAGIGITESIASADEVNKAINRGADIETKDWYNSFNQDKESMLKLIQSGDRTAQGIIQNLESKYLLSKKTKDLILNLK